MPQADTFRKFWDAGFRRLVPITPPGAPASERSSLHKRPGALGKAVGVKGIDGLWRGFDWLKHESTETDLPLWEKMGAGVGIRTGAGLVAVDIDTLDETHAAEIHDAAVRLLGPSPVRTGQAPKRLLLYRTTAPVNYRRVLFDDGGSHKPGAEARVELLTEGRQFVAHGIHTGTKQPYAWDRFPTIDDLTIVTPEDIQAYFDHLTAALPAAAQNEQSADRHEVDQNALAAVDLDEITRAVEALPNTTALFPTYDDYVRVGYAIKGASQEDPDRGLALYQSWAARWEGDNDPERVTADWSRMKPPFEIGAQYLCALAERHSEGAYDRSRVWFMPVEERPDDPFIVAEKNEAAAEEAKNPPIKWVRPAEWRGKTPPAREWEVEGWIPRYDVTLLYGEGGIGKTLLAHQYATCAAAGVNWLRQETREARVMAFFCEDSEDELHRRQLDICGAFGITLDDIDKNLRIASRKYMDNILALWDRNTGAMARQAIWDQLRRDALDFGAEVLIIDTLADTFGGSEIDRAQVNSFVKSCLGALAQETKGTVIALGHPSVSGRAEGRSGSTGWSNAARSRIYLRYPNGVESGNVRELEGMKLNYGPKGSLLKIKWDSGAFSVLAETRPEVDLTALRKASADETEERLPTVAEVNQEAVMKALVEAEAAGTALSLSPRSSLYAPKVLSRQWREYVAGLDHAAIERAIVDLEKIGAISAGIIGRKDNRHPISGYRVNLVRTDDGVWTAPANLSPRGVFD